LIAISGVRGAYLHGEWIDISKEIREREKDKRFFQLMCDVRQNQIEAKKILRYWIQPIQLRLLSVSG
jgi:hypothetical protein